MLGTLKLHLLLTLMNYAYIRYGNFKMMVYDMSFVTQAKAMKIK